MSAKTIDDRIVSLQFDNRQFEKEVAVTLSTLDKLRSKLNIPASTKAFDNITASAKKVDMTPIAKSVDTIQAKFSALDVVAVTAISNITNSLLGMSKNIINSLTFKPVMTGLSEYETKINAIQTIMSNTASKGTTMEDVTRVLDELNTYADKTIYNFAEMTRNIGTFTAAGVGLEEAASAIQGIANLAAASGSNSQQASTAMYQLSQALAAGTVKLMDWNSVVNAGMGGEKFQLALKQTAREMGIAVDSIVDKYGTFRESLHEGWISAEVLNTTLKKFTVEGATEYANAMLKSGKYTQEQADALLEEAKNMEDASTKVKTLTQLWSTLQETAQSGWAKTWEIIFGDFEQARSLFSELYDFLSPIINSISDARNNLLQGAFSSKWSLLSTEVKNAGIDIEKFQNELAKVAGVDLTQLTEQYGSFEASLSSGWAKADLVKQALQNIAAEAGVAASPVEDMNAKLEEFQRIVDEVWQGTWKNGADRIKLLTDAGYDYAEVQGLVNKSINGYRLTLEDLSETQMKAVGYTEEEIEAIKNLMAQAEDAKSPISELINTLDKPSGRELFLNSLYNMVQPLIKSIELLNKAWRNAFPPMTSQKLYNILEGFNSLTKALVISDETAEKLSNTFNGLFAVIDLLFGGLKIVIGPVFNAITSGLQHIFSLLGMGTGGLLDITSNIGKAIVAFRDWAESMNYVEQGIAALSSNFSTISAFITNIIAATLKVDSVVKSIDKFRNSLKQISDTVTNNFGGVVSLINEFVLAVSKLKPDELSKIPELFSELVTNIQSELKNVDFFEIGQNIIQGLTNGIRTGLTSAINLIVQTAKAIMTTFCELLGIHSPSVVFEGYGENIIEGLANGIQNGLNLIKDIIKTLVGAIIKIVGSLDFTDIALIGGGFGILFVANQLSKALSMIAKPFGAISGILNEVKQVFDTIEKYINAQVLKVKAEALYTMAKAIAILAGSLVVLTLVDPNKLLAALGSLSALIVVLGIFIGYAALLTRFVEASKIEDIGKVAIMFISLSASLALLAFAMKNIASIDATSTEHALSTISKVLLYFAGLIAVYGLFVKGMSASNISKVGGMFMKLVVSLLILSLAIKLLGEINPASVEQAMEIIDFISLLMVALIATSSIAVHAKDAGNLILKFATSLLVVGAAIKLIGSLDLKEIGQSMMVLSMLTGLYAALILASAIPQNGITDSGTMMLKLASSILIIGLAIKLIGSLSMSDVIKGIAVIGACGLLFYAMISVSKIADKDSGTVSFSFMKMAAAIAILSLTMRLIAGLDSEDIIKALGFMSGCTLIFLAISKLSKYAGQYSSQAGTMFIKMAAAIALLTISVRLIRSLSYDDITKGLVFIAGCEAIFMALVWVSKYAGKHADKAGEMLMKMAIPIAVLAASVAVLSLLDPSRVAFASASMVAVVLSLAAAIKASSAIGEKVSMKPFIMIAVILGLLAGIIALLSFIPVESAIGNALALSSLMIALSVALIAMSMSGKVAPQAMIGMLALSGVVAILAVILGALSYMNLELSIQNAISLSILLVSMAAVFMMLSSVGVLAPVATAGAIAFVKVVAIITAMLAALGALVTYFPKVEEFINNGIPLLETMARGLGSVISSFVSGLVSGLTSGLPEIGKNLSSFMINAMPFILGTKLIDESSMKAVGSLASAILVLTGADIINGIAKMFGAGVSFEEFGENIVALGTAMAAYSDEVKDIKPYAVLASAQAAESLSKVVSNLPNSGGWLGTILGENDMDTFGKQLVIFGRKLTEYSNTVEGLKVEPINTSVTAAKSLSELANSLPNSGGWAGTILGENDMDDFGKQLVTFGSKLTEYSNSVSELKVEPIETSVTAARLLSDLANELPNTGGLAASILGDNDLETFATNLTTFGTAISGYSDSVSNIKLMSILASTMAAKSLVGVFNALPETGGLASWFDGSKNLGSFSTNIQLLGTSISKYSQSVEGINADAVTTATSAAKSLVSMIQNMVGIDISGVTLFKQAMETLTSISFDTFLGDVTTLNENLTNIGWNIVTAIANGITLGQETINLTFANMILMLFEYLASYQETFIMHGYQLIVMFGQGILLGIPYANIMMTILVMNMYTTLMLNRHLFYNAGMNMVMGFIQGIQDHIWMAAQAAAEMARQAIEAANAELGIASPSKVFTKIGKFIPEGLIRGISSMGKAVTAASKDMANKSINGTNNILSKINDKLYSELNNTPVIRPVMDLDAMESDIETLNSMFSSEAVLPSLSHVKANLPSDKKEASKDQNELQNANKGTVVNYTQINNSPKALDRTTIYRQTKNQLSTLKGALSKS